MKYVWSSFFAVNFGYGMYRGLFSEHYKKRFPESNELFTSKALVALYAGVLQINLFTLPVNLFYIARRTEKHIRGMPITEEDNLY